MHTFVKSIFLYNTPLSFFFFFSTRALCSVSVSFHTVIFLRFEGGKSYTLFKRLCNYKIDLENSLKSLDIFTRKKRKNTGNSSWSYTIFQIFFRAHTQVRLEGSSLAKGNGNSLHRTAQVKKSKIGVTLRSYFSLLPSFFFLSTLAYYSRTSWKSRTVYSHRRARGEK